MKVYFNLEDEYKAYYSLNKFKNIKQLLAERERFELSVHVSTYGHLANDWFKPLTHLSMKPIYLYFS